MKYSKTTLMELSHKYRNILKKCALLNAAILMGAALAAPAGAEYVPVDTRTVVGSEGVPFDNNSFTGLTSSDYGGAIYNMKNAGSVTVSNSLFDGNYISGGGYNQGGAIYVNTSSPVVNTITDSTFTGNYTSGKNSRGGAVYINNDGSSTNIITNISGSTFTKNKTLRADQPTNVMGSAIYQSGGTLNLTNNTFGGATMEDANEGTTTVVAQYATVNLSGNTFQRNISKKEGVLSFNNHSAAGNFSDTNTFDSNDGHALYVFNGSKGNQTNPAGIVTFKEGSKTYFTGNSALNDQDGQPDGGAIYNAYNGTVTFEAGSEAEFTGNKGTKGGAIFNQSSLTFKSGSDVSFTQNEGTDGGAIYNDGGSITIGDNAVFTNNHATGDGNDIMSNGGSITIGDNLQIIHNDAATPGDCNIYAVEGTNLIIGANAIFNGGSSTADEGDAIVIAQNSSTTRAKFTLGDNASFSNFGDAALIVHNGTDATIGKNATFDNTGLAIQNSRKSKTTVDDGFLVKNAGNSSWGAVLNRAADGGDDQTTLEFLGTATFKDNTNTALYNRLGAITTFSGETIFENNVTTGNGGAIRNVDGTATYNSIVTFNDNVTFSINSADKGGAIYNDANGIVVLNGTSTFSGNTAAGVVNDVYNKGNLTIGGTIVLTGADSGDGNITGDGTVTFKSGSLLKGTLLSSETPLINVGTLEVADGVGADLTFDIADTEATWAYAKADTWTGSDFTLSDATKNLNSLFDIQAGAEKGTLVVTRKPVDEIIDNMEEAGASANEAATVAAIAQVETASIADPTARNIAATIKDAAQTGDIKTVKELTDRVNPAEAPLKHVVSATTAIMGAVTTRMSVAANTPAPVVGRSGGDSKGGKLPITNLSPWIQGLYNKTHNSQGIGFDAYSKGFAFGADTRLKDVWTLGVGYAYTATDVKNSQRKTQIYGDNYFIYGEYKPSNWYLNGILAVGHARYKDVSVLTSNYDVDSYSAQLLGGYQTGLFNNYAGMRYTLIKTENYNNGLTTVNAKNTQVATAIIGTKVSKDFKCEKGVVWTPEFRLAGTYDVKSEASRAIAGIIGSPATYSVTGDRLSRAALQTGISLTAKVKKFELIGGYDVELRSQNNTQAVNLKAIYHF